mgnify:CR=1 FL=1
MDGKKTIMIKDSFSELGEIQRAFTPEQVKFVMEAVAPGLNEKEVWLFLLKANVLKLNPLLGEIFAYAYVDRQTGQRRLVVIEGRNGKRNLAAGTGKVEYIKTEAIYVKKITQEVNDPKSSTGKSTVEMTIKTEPWDGVLWGARSEVKIKDVDQPVVETVKLTEYNTGKSVWEKKPETMIKKVAESQALSSALPKMMLDLVGEAENFVQERTMLTEGGDKPATDQQLKALKSVGGDMKKTYTAQEANEEIIRITREKAQKKREAKKTEEVKPAA